MPEYSCFPEPPSADEPTDLEVARYLVARCRELLTLAEHVGNAEVDRYLREASNKAQDFLDRIKRGDA